MFVNWVDAMFRDLLSSEVLVCYWDERSCAIFRPAL
jgi:hypothetical protein